MALGLVLGLARPPVCPHRPQGSGCHGKPLQRPPSLQKAALAQLPELPPAQPELRLAGDQPPVLGTAQPAPEVLPAAAHGHHGEVLPATQAGLDVVSWRGGGREGVPRGGELRVKVMEREGKNLKPSSVCSAWWLLALPACRRAAGTCGAWRTLQPCKSETMVFYLSQILNHVGLIKAVVAPVQNFLACTQSTAEASPQQWVHRTRCPAAPRAAEAAVPTVCLSHPAGLCPSS